MFINNFDPVAFQVFSFEIRWYSLSYIFGIIFGWIYCNKILIKEPKIKDLFSDYISYLIIGILVGGRLGYVFFYNFNYYFNNPIEIIIKWSRTAKPPTSVWQSNVNCLAEGKTGMGI